MGDGTYCFFANGASGHIVKNLVHLVGPGWIGVRMRKEGKQRDDADGKAGLLYAQ